MNWLNEIASILWTLNSNHIVTFRFFVSFNASSLIMILSHISIVWNYKLMPHWDRLKIVVATPSHVYACSCWLLHSLFVTIKSWLQFRWLNGRLTIVNLRTCPYLYLLRRLLNNSIILTGFICYICPDTERSRAWFKRIMMKSLHIIRRSFYIIWNWLCKNLPWRFIIIIMVSWA